MNYLKTEVKNGKSRRIYSAPSHSEASLFAHIFNGVYVRYIGETYQVII